MGYYGAQVRWQQATRAVHSNTLWHPRTEYKSWRTSLRLPLNSWWMPGLPAYNVWYWAMDGSSTFTGGISKKIAHLLDGGLSFAGGVVKKTTHFFSVTLLTFSGGIVKKTMRAFSATPLPFGGSLTKKTAHNVTGSASFAGGVLKQTAKAVDGLLLFAGSILWRLLRAVTAGLTFTGALDISFHPSPVTTVRKHKRLSLFSRDLPEEVYQWLM